MDDLIEQLQAEQRRLGERIEESGALLRAARDRVALLERAAAEARSRLEAAEAELDRLPARALWDLTATWSRAEHELAAARIEQAVLAERQLGFDYALVLLEQALAALASGPTPNGAPAGDHAEQVAAAAALVEAQEEERRRVARQIHDGPVQALSNLVLRTEICERLSSTAHEEAQAELSRLKQLAANTLREMRRFIFDLRPMILDDLGLVPTVRRYLFDCFPSNSLSHVELRVFGRERRLPVALEVTLFRVVQTALANVAAHARVAEALVAIGFGPAEVRVEVIDRGVGFDAERALLAAQEQHGSGLGVLSERVRLVGGTLRIESAPGAGTTVSVTVPVPE